MKPEYIPILPFVFCLLMLAGACSKDCGPLPRPGKLPRSDAPPLCSPPSGREPAAESDPKQPVLFHHGARRHSGSAPPTATGSTGGAGATDVCAMHLNSQARK